LAFGDPDRRRVPDDLDQSLGVAGYGMASMLDIVTEAKIAASRGWDRARRAAFRTRETASPDALARVIEADIIPRLLLAHGAQGAHGGAAHPAFAGHAPIMSASEPAIPPNFADQFAAATLTEEVAPLLARVEALMARGIGIESIYLHLLAPAARRLAPAGCRSEWRASLRTARPSEARPPWCPLRHAPV